MQRDDEGETMNQPSDQGASWAPDPPPLVEAPPVPQGTDRVPFRLAVWNWALLGLVSLSLFAMSIGRSEGEDPAAAAGRAVGTVIGCFILVIPVGWLIWLCGRHRGSLLISRIFMAALTILALLGQVALHNQGPGGGSLADQATLRRALDQYQQTQQEFGQAESAREQRDLARTLRRRRDLVIDAMRAVSRAKEEQVLVAVQRALKKIDPLEEDQLTALVELEEGPWMNALAMRRSAARLSCEGTIASYRGAASSILREHAELARVVTEEFRRLPDRKSIVRDFVGAMRRGLDDAGSKREMHVRRAELLAELLRVLDDEGKWEAGEEGDFLFYEDEDLDGWNRIAMQVEELENAITR